MAGEGALRGPAIHPPGTGRDPQMALLLLEFLVLITEGSPGQQDVSPGYREPGRLLGCTDLCLTTRAYTM